MAGNSNFQDAVVLNQDTLSFQGEQLIIGSGPGSKSIVFSNSQGALHLIASATQIDSVFFNDAGGTIGLVTAFAAGGVSVTNGQLIFSNAGNISFGIAGSTLTASAGQSVQPAVSGIGVSNIGNTLGNTGTTLGTYVLAGIGNITLSQVTAAGSLATLSISVGVQSTGPSALAAGTQTGTSGTFVFANSNGLSFGMSGSTQITATADYVRSISAGTTNATGNQIVFSNLNGVSFGAAGATITASIAAPANNRVFAFSQWAEFDTNYSVSQASLSIQKVSVPVVVNATQGIVLMNMLGNTNSSGAMTISMGVYTINASTASLASSGSRAITWTSGALTTASSQYGGVSGTRYRTIPINLSMTPGDYLFAFHVSTANNGTWQVFGRQAASVAGIFDGAETNFWVDGFSNSTVAALPSSVVVTNTNYQRTGVGAMRQPGVILAGTF